MTAHRDFPVSLDTADVTRSLVTPTCKNQICLDATGADKPQTGPS